MELNTTMLLAVLITAFCIILKFILWVRIGDYNIPEFLGSFLHFFSTHEIYDTDKKGKSTFMRFNNKLNILVYLAIVLFVISYMLDTDDVEGLVPTKKEARKYKIK
jgi:hypothetical protein